MKTKQINNNETNKRLIPKNRIFALMRLFMTDVFKAVLLPIAILTFLSIVNGVLQTIVVNIDEKSSSYYHLNVAWQVIRELINLVPLFTALSIAVAFSFNKSLAAILTIIGWAMMLMIQSMFIYGETGSFSYLNTSIKNIEGTEIIDTYMGYKGFKLAFVRTNVLLGFLVGYLNAKIVNLIYLSKSKRLFLWINKVILTSLTIIGLSIAFGILHVSLMMPLIYLVQQVATTVNSNQTMVNNNSNTLVAYMLILGLNILNFDKGFELMFLAKDTTYFDLILSMFVAPFLGMVFIISANKGRQTYAVSIYAISIIISLLFGQYHSLIITLFFLSPLMYFVIIVLITPFISWFAILSGLTITTNMPNGGWIVFIKDVLIPTGKGVTGFKDIWTIFCFGILISIITSVSLYYYIKKAYVSVVGSGLLSKEGIQDINKYQDAYVVFDKKTYQKVLQEHENLDKNSTS
ncbi:hypothetical protein FJO69_01715 [[Mycoplasma] falconis]|uniref:Uncharacterized protein n=1 Tax=[Mycoplasma] falconis TaxID=92403 RepID=A0A501X9V5_9BACT|nr:hypothetical protein [[Mycoplasma] falconis]TPE57335.1 hypothetical protein FJO69_01715 [[Mycoplasma] falconis]